MEEKHRVIRENTLESLSSPGACMVGVGDKEGDLRELSLGRDIWIESWTMNRRSQVTGAGRTFGVEKRSCARTLGLETENLFERLKEGSIAIPPWMSPICLKNWKKARVVRIYRERTVMGCAWRGRIFVTSIGDFALSSQSSRALWIIAHREYTCARHYQQNSEKRKLFPLRLCRSYWTTKSHFQYVKCFCILWLRNYKHTYKMATKNYNH